MYYPDFVKEKFKRNSGHNKAILKKLKKENKLLNIQ